MIHYFYTLQMITTISLVVICHHTKWSQYYRPYSPCETFHPHHHSFFFVTRSLYLLISFTYFTHSLDPSSGSHLIFLCIYEASLTAQLVKNPPAVQETWVRSLGREDTMEKEMATHSSTLAWKIPWTEEPCWLQSMGLQRVGHDWATSLHFFKVSKTLKQI